MKKNVFFVFFTIATLLLPGCRGHVAWDWTPPHKIFSANNKAFPKANAVVISRVDRYENYRGSSNMMVEHHHDVIRLFTEKSLRQGRLEFYVPEESTLTEFEGRTLRRDGSIVPVAPEQIIKQESTYVDDDGGDEQKGTLYIVKFPRLQVGAAIEYSYSIRHSSSWSGFRRTVNDSLPILDYQLHVLTTAKFGFQLRLYNTKRKLRSSREGLMLHLNVHLKDVPARKEESYSPDPSLRNVWFRYKATYGQGNVWSNALWWPGKMLIDDDKDKRSMFGPRIELSESEKERCSSSRNRSTCKLRALLKSIHKKTDWSGHGSWRKFSSVEKMLESRQASGVGQNVLLYDALSNASVKAEWILVTRRFSKAVDYGFALNSWFNYAILRVKVDQKTYFVDAGCSYCAVGELPYYLQGQDGVLLTKRLLGSFKVDGEWVKITGRPHSTPWQRDEVDVVIGEDGNANVHFKRKMKGAIARNWRRKTRLFNEKSWLRYYHAEATSMAPAMKNIVDSDKNCPTLGDDCEMSFSFEVPNYAGRLDDKIFVPLSIFAEEHTPSVSEIDDDNRIGDVFFAAGYRQEEKLILHLPPHKSLLLPDEVHRVGDGSLWFSVSVTKEHDKVIVLKTLVVHAGRYNRRAQQKMAQTLYAYRQAGRELLSLTLASDP
ncbi:MAG: DUF3857 domain-containing protein [Deltaproteobacteria bacterium]|nr:DUF3857 domain-containing protein [Deltaproteobacteria bacterium]